MEQHPMRHIATYVCDTDPARTAQYPFSEGQTPPRHIRKDGATFTLRVCVYDVDETAPKRPTRSVAEQDADQARRREWNARHHGRLAVAQDIIANDQATAGEVAA